MHGWKIRTLAHRIPVENLKNVTCVDVGNVSRKNLNFGRYVA